MPDLLAGASGLIIASCEPCQCVHIHCRLCGCVSLVFNTCASAIEQLIGRVIPTDHSEDMRIRCPVGLLLHGSKIL